MKLQIEYLLDLKKLNYCHRANQRFHLTALAMVRVLTLNYR